MLRSRIFTRSVLATAVIALFALQPPPAHAQNCSFNLPTSQSSYGLSLSISGLSSSGLYSPACYSWGPSADSTGQGVSRQLSATIPVDSTVATLMTAAQSGQLLPSAEFQQTLQGTVSVDILMTNVHIVSVRTSGAPDALLMTLNLKFDSVTFTYQPVNTLGQRNGTPVTFSVAFKN